MFASACSRVPSKRVRRPGPLAALVVSTSIAGCAVQPATSLPDLSAWDQRQEALGGLDTWAFNGRIAVRSEADGFNGKLRFRHEAGDFEAVMSGPLGIGTVMLARDAGTLVYTDKDGVQTEFTDPELEFRYRFGYDVPLESLRYWALGIPDPGQPAETVLNDAGQLASMVQNGWDVAVARYRDAGGEMMPQRLTATREATKVTLVIDRWDFSDSQWQGRR